MVGSRFSDSVFQWSRSGNLVLDEGWRVQTLAKPAFNATELMLAYSHGHTRELETHMATHVN